MGNIYDLLMRGEAIGDEATIETPQIILPEKALGRQRAGSIITLGGKEYIVLGREDGGVSLLKSRFAKYSEFGGSNSYPDSYIREYLNGEYLDELASVVGRENILRHTVDITADDGTGVDFVEDNISLITTERYRRYRQYIPEYGEWWWTATKVSNVNGYSRRVVYVDSDGVLDWVDFGNGFGGVRPFCILNPEILVD